jgi:hypothetical protein
LFAHHLESAVIGADSLTLDDISRACSRGLAEGAISEVDAGAIYEAVQARRLAIRQSPGPKPPTPTLPKRREPRSANRQASLERRRRQASSGSMPPALAANFTLAEQAALAVIARQCQRHGRCDLHMDAIAGLAGCCRTTVQNALREARHRGLIAVEERRLRWNRNDTNLVMIISPEWQTWLRLGGRVQKAEHHGYQNLNSGRSSAAAALQRARRYEQGARLSLSYADSA